MVELGGRNRRDKTERAGDDVSHSHTAALRRKPLPTPTALIEWAPGQVEALNVAQNRRATGTTIEELKSVFSGQKDVTVGVARSAVFLRTLRLPKAAPEDLRSLVGMRMAQLFPLPADQLAYDFYQSEDQNADGFLTSIVAMRSQDLQQLNRELKSAGLHATKILPVALGAAEIAQQEGQKDALVLGEVLGGYSLDVVQAGVVRLSRSVSADSDLSREAQRTLAAAGLSELPWLTTGQLSLPNVRAASGSVVTHLYRSLPVAFELTEERLQATKAQRAGRTRLAVLMMLSALLLAAYIWTEFDKGATLRREREAASERELSKFRVIRDTKGKTAAAAGTVETTLKSSFEPGQNLSDVAAVIGDSLPATAWLTGLSLERGKPVQIRGAASQENDVARFVEALGTSNRFRDVKLLFANASKIEQTPIVQFSVTAFAVGNLPLPVAKKITKVVRTRSTTPEAGGAK